MPERGSALLAVLLFGLSLVLVSTVLAEIARQAALELTTRRDALCARYAALSGLTLGPIHAQLAPLSDRAESTLAVWYELDGHGRCVLHSRARCGLAQRTFARIAPDPVPCAHR